MADFLEEDLEEIHYSLHVTTHIGKLLCAIEKYFGGNVNYYKGKGSMFMYYMRRYHHTAYLYPVSQACGRSSQDIGVEGLVAVLTKILRDLEFLIWRMSCGGDGILEKKYIYIILRSVEMVTLLCVLSILNISLCLPLRWLAGNCSDLGKYGFVVADIPKAVDLMDKAFAEITKDRNLMLDDDFTMNIFEPLARKIKPFK